MSEENQSNETTNTQPTAPPPVQAELPIQVQTKAAQPAAPAADPMKLAEIIAENKSMKAKLTELTAAQGQEAQERRDAEQKALHEKYKADLEAARMQAEAAAASAKRNAVKAHFNGLLKADEYLALIPPVEFSEAGDLTQESIDALDAFRAEKQELFHQQTGATTPMSQTGANMTAHGFDEDTARALTMNKIALPGQQGHWGERKSADLMRNIVGHNAGHRPYGKVN